MQDDFFIWEGYFKKDRERDIKELTIGTDE